MICPVCKDQAMSTQQPEPGLMTHICGQCSGRWIASYQYWKWKEDSGRSLVINPAADQTTQPVQDNTAAKLCPECGHFLRRFPVGKGLDFGLDRCGNCGGTWFDANEWEVLKNKGLHEDIHKIFSEVWQNQVRSEEHQAAMEAFYKEKFGEEGFQKAKDIKAWIESNPYQAELRAFLGL